MKKLAYFFSPLACGILSGKYSNNKIPNGTRKSINNSLGNRNSKLTNLAAEEYFGLAKKYSLDPCQMALSFCLSRPFMTSVIFGATNEIQLLNNIKSTNLKLEKQNLTEITKIHRKYPIPF